MILIDELQYYVLRTDDHGLVTFKSNGIGETIQLEIRHRELPQPVTVTKEVKVGKENMVGVEV